MFCNASCALKQGVLFVKLTQQVSRHINRHYDCEGGDGNNHEQDDQMTLEGQIVDGVYATFLLDLFFTGTQKVFVKVVKFKPSILPRMTRQI